MRRESRHREAGASTRDRRPWSRCDRILKGTVFSKYKQFVENCFELMPRHALHAHTLGFLHPSLNKQMNFESLLPDDFNAVIEKWRNYSAHSQ